MAAMSLESRYATTAVLNMGFNESLSLQNMYTTTVLRVNKICEGNRELKRPESQRTANNSKTGVDVYIL